MHETAMSHGRINQENIASCIRHLNAAKREINRAPKIDMEEKRLLLEEIDYCITHRPR